MNATPSTAMPTAKVPIRAATAAPLITGPPGPRVEAVGEVVGWVVGLADHAIPDPLTLADDALTGTLLGPGAVVVGAAETRVAEFGRRLRVHGAEYMLDLSARPWCCGRSVDALHATRSRRDRWP